MSPAKSVPDTVGLIINCHQELSEDSQGSSARPHAFGDEQMNQVNPLESGSIFGSLRTGSESSDNIHGATDSPDQDMIGIKNMFDDVAERLKVHPATRDECWIQLTAPRSSSVKKPQDEQCPREGDLKVFQAGRDPHDQGLSSGQHATGDTNVQGSSPLPSPLQMRSRSDNGRHTTADPGVMHGLKMACKKALDHLLHGLSIYRDDSADRTTTDELKVDHPDPSAKLWIPLKAEALLASRKPLSKYLMAEDNTALFIPREVIGRPWHTKPAFFETPSPASLRADTMRKLVKGIFPNSSLLVVSEPRMPSIILYARQLEAEIYKRSWSRGSYDQLTDKKIHDIQEELEEKRKRVGTPNQPWKKQPDNITLALELAARDSDTRYMSSAVRQLREALEWGNVDLRQKRITRLVDENPDILKEWLDWLGFRKAPAVADSGKEETRRVDHRPTGISRTHFNSKRSEETGSNAVFIRASNTDKTADDWKTGIREHFRFMQPTSWQGVTAACVWAFILIGSILFILSFTGFF